MTETIEGFHVEYDIILTQVYTFKKLEHVVVNGNLVFWDLPKCCRKIQDAMDNTLKHPIGISKLWTKSNSARHTIGILQKLAQIITCDI